MNDRRYLEAVLVSLLFIIIRYMYMTFSGGEKKPFATQLSNKKLDAYLFISFNTNWQP